MTTPNSRSKALLDKVYDHLDSIDVTKLSMRELQDFLEVVQKGQFLETYGQASNFGLGGFGSVGFTGFNMPPANGQGDAGISTGTDKTTVCE